MKSFKEFLKDQDEIIILESKHKNPVNKRTKHGFKDKKQYKQFLGLLKRDYKKENDAEKIANDLAPRMGLEGYEDFIRDSVESYREFVSGVKDERSRRRNEFMKHGFKIKKETPKAYVVYVNFDLYNVEKDMTRTTLFPKSQVEVDGNMVYPKGWIFDVKMEELRDEMSNIIGRAGGAHIVDEKGDVIQHMS